MFKKFAAFISLFIPTLFLVVGGPVIPAGAEQTTLNEGLQAVASQNSGANEPSVTFPYMFWADTTTGKMQQRNAANTAWIELWDLATGPVTGSSSGSNLIINGNAEINQENNTNPAVDDYTIGDLYNYLGEAAATVTRATTGSPTGSNFHWNVRIDGANAQASLVYFLQNADIQSALSDGTVSFSFQAKTTSAKEIANLRVAILSWTGTADSVTSNVVATWGSGGTNPTFATNWTLENTPSNLALTTSFQEFTVENVAIDTAGTNNLAVFIWTDDGTIAINDEFQVAQWMLNTGAQAFPFTQPPVATVEDQVAYYIQRWDLDTDNGELFAPGVSNNTANNLYVKVPMRRNMRVAPSVTLSAVDTWGVSGLGGNPTSFAHTQSTRKDGVWLNYIKTGAFTAGNAFAVAREGTDTTWVMLDARF